MRPKKAKDWIVVLFQDMGFAVEGILCRKKKTTPSYLAHNIAWFTNCSWLEQISAFDQLSEWLYQGKGQY